MITTAPRARPITLQERRAALEAAVLAAIAILDDMDGEADLEAVCEDEGAQCEDEGAPTGDLEPWLGAPEGSQHYTSGSDDLELDRSPVDPDDDPGEFVARCEVGLF